MRPTKVPDTGQTSIESVGPEGPTPTERITGCRSLGTDTVSNALTNQFQFRLLDSYEGAIILCKTIRIHIQQSSDRMTKQ